MRRWPASHFFHRHRTTVLIALFFVAALVVINVVWFAKPAPVNTKSSQLSDADHRALYEAEEILVAHCMQHAGFQYWIPPYPTPTPDDTIFPFLPASPAWAQKYGFGGPAAPPDPNLAYFSGLSHDKAAEYGADLNGGPAAPQVRATSPQGIVVSHSSGGCVAVAEGILYGNFGAWFQAHVTMENLAPMWEFNAAADPAYARSTHDWSRCMLASGYAYPTPQSAVERFTSDTGPPAASKPEPLSRQRNAPARCT